MTEKTRKQTRDLSNKIARMDCTCNNQGTCNTCFLMKEMFRSFKK